MWDFLKRLAGREETPRPVPATTDRPEPPPFAPATTPRAEPPPAPRAPGHRAGPADERTDDSYFDVMGGMHEAIKRRDFPLAVRLVRQNLSQIPAFVKRTRKEKWPLPPSIPALERGGTILAVAEDEEGLEAMRRLVDSTPELADRKADIEAHFEDLALLRRILAALKENPGCLQTDMKQRVGAADSRRLSTLVGWLEKAGRIVRTKQGKTWALTLAGDAPAGPAGLPKRTPGSHRKGQPPLALKPIEFDSLPYVPLPRAPLIWEERESGRVPEEPAPPAGPFEVREAPSWHLAETTSLAMAERADPAYRRFLSSSHGLFLVDDLGKAEAFPSAPAAALRYDEQGRLAAAAPLLHDTYRLASNPLGTALAALSRNAVFHAYDRSLAPLVETGLADAPEMQRIAARLDLGSELRTFVRSVALSADGERYLVTCVNEAWCFTRDGRGVWGLAFPTKADWREVAEPAGETGTSEEITEALALMGLALPLAGGDVRARYRELAMAWHPDTNPGDPAAGARMVALNHAAALLSGVDLARIEERKAVRYEKTLSRDTFSVGGIDVEVFMSMGTDGTGGLDWIYAAAFAGEDGGAYLAGYSGRIVQVDTRGNPLRVYDIGVVPRTIADTGDFLYVLTDTRLYVLQGEVLHAVIDVFGGGELVVGHTGFGVVEKKRLRWFGEDGTFEGSVVSKDPIRRVYHDGRSLVVETRKRRARIEGASPWWPA